VSTGSVSLRLVGLAHADYGGKGLVTGKQSKVAYVSTVSQSLSGTDATRYLVSPVSKVSWPLQEIVILRGFCVRINHPCTAPSHLHCPHYCNAIARLLCNIRRPPDPPFVCHTPYNIDNGNNVC